MCMTLIMWIILNINNTQTHELRVSLGNLLFTYRPGGPRKEHLWVMHLLVCHSPFSFIDNFYAATSNKTTDFVDEMDRVNCEEQ